jgi:hypothetical protein
LQSSQLPCTCTCTHPARPPWRCSKYLRAIPAFEQRETQASCGGQFSPDAIISYASQQPLKSQSSSCSQCALITSTSSRRFRRRAEFYNLEKDHRPSQDAQPRPRNQSRRPPDLGRADGGHDSQGDCSAPSGLNSVPKRPPGLLLSLRSIME